MFTFMIQVLDFVVFQRAGLFFVFFIAKLPNRIRCRPPHIPVRIPQQVGQTGQELRRRRRTANLPNRLRCSPPHIPVRIPQQVGQTGQDLRRHRRTPEEPNRLYPLPSRLALRQRPTLNDGDHTRREAEFVQKCTKY
jgi:hypothetical protein